MIQSIKTLSLYSASSIAALSTYIYTSCWLSLIQVSQPSLF